MPPTNANPGAGGARVHGISSSNDAASTTRNQPAAQSNPARSAQANATLAATAILNKARELGIRVGAAPDGSELILVAPLRLPYETRRWFEVWLDNFRTEVIDIILQENAGGRS